MNYRRHKLWTLLECLFVLTLLLTSADAATWTVGPSSGPGIDYTSIQTAINSATAGDTILVKSGTYNEDVNVNKALILRSVGIPVVNASSPVGAIILSANGCTLEGFKVSNSFSGNAGIRVTSSYNTISGNTANANTQYGIRLDYSSNNKISDNNATGCNLFSILLYSSSGNTISGNTATGSVSSIYLDSSSNNIISDNIATGNRGSGIYLSYSSNGNTISGNNASSNSGSGIYLDSTSNSNTISGNTANANTQYGIRLSSSSNNNILSNNANSNIGSGIYLSSSSGNTISGNTATGNTKYGIFLSSSSNSNTISGNTANDNILHGIILFSSSNINTISGNTANGNTQNGIFLYSSSNNEISGNTANGNSVHGISIDYSNNNNVSRNTANDNTQSGIHVYYSASNNIMSNTATGNNPGIYLYSSSSNIIYLNTFNNNNNARSTGTNHWNATTTQTYDYDGRTLTGLLGNIWSDYDGIDCDGDGVGDMTYNITGGSEKDYHPIGGIEADPGIEVQKIADRSEAQVGEMINYTIWVNNTGDVTLKEVRAWDNLTGAEWSIGTLDPGQNYTNATRYQVKLSDLPGPLANELRANGTDTCGIDANDSAIETVEVRYN